ncbi:PREDICTED: uncharacterized protein LOC104600811 [Nelumbo nucifera]|uniref:Dolichyl-diphosphooligosaccharide-protein glycosyltransferase subunit OST5 n=2 Tax=Nelumbo nucifera TaxID=4432 RepID=A0A1U8AAI6_NELNU|nr:PREDICTED: uncharacterized protein LOC104600811 [Nelumbo nucifera]DAD44427.1 TPA_asm: hypothetical protein HUJ06_002657 [Nelumbo nucifera]
MYQSSVSQAKSNSHGSECPIHKASIVFHQNCRDIVGPTIGGPNTDNQKSSKQLITHLSKKSLRPSLITQIIKNSLVSNQGKKEVRKLNRSSSSNMASAAKPITSPVPDAWYPTLAVLMLIIGLVVTASFFIYEATSSKRYRSLAKELTTGAVASVFLGFGSLFLLLACGVYV